MPMVTIACPCDATSNASLKTCWNFFSSGMTWSAGSTAMTPVVERAPTSAAPSVTAAQVSRPIGSATRLAFGIFGSCFWTSGNCASLVMTKMFFAGTSGSTRSTASCKKDFLPSSASSCLGIFSRLNGQKRSPRPPAMMMTNRSLVSVFAFINFPQFVAVPREIIHHSCSRQLFGFAANVILLPKSIPPSSIAKRRRQFPQF